MEEIINRVAKSPLKSLDLEEYFHQGERVVFDIADCLFQRMILREKDFRAFIKETDWSTYGDKNVAIICSEDAIMPTWAYMLIVSALSPYAHYVVFGNLEQLENALFQMALSKINPEDFEGSKVVIKGCSNLPVPTFAYTELMRILTPVASSIMYGEPCSTVPLYKKRKGKM